MMKKNFLIIFSFLICCFAFCNVVSAERHCVLITYTDDNGVDQTVPTIYSDDKICYHVHAENLSSYPFNIDEYIYEGTDNVFIYCPKNSKIYGCETVESYYCLAKTSKIVKVEELSMSSEECGGSGGSGSSSSADNENKVSCGKLGSINKKIPELTSWFITITEIVVPIILIIMGIIDFVKSLSSQKEDEIKRGQQIFIKRLITSVIIFFVIVIVKLLVNILSSGSSESGNIIDCIECFINNNCN